MRYRRLGSSNLEVSVLCLGTMTFADRTNRAEASAILASAREHGVNFLDTADVYSLGRCEALLGELLGNDRKHWVLASKVGNPMGEQPGLRGYSRRWMLRALEDSLTRLRTDHLDIWYLHRDWEDANLEEPVAVIGDQILAGKIRAWGLSNFRGWRIAQIVHLSRALGVPPPIICQPYYNLLNRTPEVEILPACEAMGLGVAPYSPIARGVLSGKYTPGAQPDPESRAGRGDRRMMQTEWRPESLEIAQRLAEHCAARGSGLVAFAVRWLLANRTVSSVIAGPRTLEQWMAYLPAVELPWSDEDEALIDALVVPGHASTPGYNDPQYPLQGRRGAANPG